MSSLTKDDRRRDRAERLRLEAVNCVRIAVGEPDTGHAADLIDEALRLSRRSEELAR